MDVFIKTEIHHQKIKLLYSAATHVGLGVIQRESKSKPPQRLLTAADLRITGAVYATSFRLSVHARRVQHRGPARFWLSGCQADEMRRSQDSESGLGTWEERQFLGATVTVVTVSADLCRFHGSQRLTSANCRHLGSTAAAAVSSCSV